MINVSKQWNDRKEERNLIVSADITFRDGQKLTTKMDDIMQGGLQIEDAVSTQGSFDLGSAIIGKAILTLNNYDERFSAYDFWGAEIRIKISLYIEGKLLETIKKGVYTVDSASTLGNVVRLECLDWMEYFDRPYDTNLTYPATLGQIVNDVCVNCGVPLRSVNFFNAAYIVTERPKDSELTYREIISYAAQLAGCFARMNNEGQLELKWYDTEAFTEFLDGGQMDQDRLSDTYDGGNFTEYEEKVKLDGGSFTEQKKYHLISSYNTLDVSTDDILITGFKIIQLIEGEKAEEKVYSYGEEGYVLAIENNPLAQDNLQGLANSIGSKIVGMRFRPLTCQALSDPSIEAGDVAIMLDRKGNLYPCYLTNLSYTIGSYETYTCDAKTEGEQKSVRYSPYTKLQRKVAEAVNQNLSGFDQQFNQFNDLISHAMGFYRTNEQQEDDSTITYLHDKPTITESKTIWKFSVDGFAVSLDGGKTWTAGMTKDGNIIGQILSVIGINAEWITAGIIKALNIQGCEIQGGTIKGTYIEAGTMKSTEIQGSNINGASIKSGTVEATNISGGEIKGTNIKSSNIESGTMKATNIQGCEISGTNIRGSYIESVSGSNKTTINSGIIVTNRIGLKQENAQEGYLAPDILSLWNRDGSKGIILDTNGYVTIQGVEGIIMDGLLWSPTEINLRTSGNGRPVINGHQIVFQMDLNDYMTRSESNSQITGVYSSLSAYGQVINSLSDRVSALERR